MTYTKDELSGLAEAVRHHRHNDNPDATKVTLRECSSGERTLLSLKITVDLTKIQGTLDSVFIGNLGIENLLRTVLGDKTVAVEDMAVAIYPSRVRISAFVWTA